MSTIKTLKNKDKSREKSNANLNPFKKGQSGNPKGRPKKEHCIADILNDILKQKSVLDPEKKKTNLQIILEKCVLQAMGGDRDARNFIADRTEGKALERIKNYDGIDELEIL